MNLPLVQQTAHKNTQLLIKFWRVDVSQHKKKKKKMNERFRKTCLTPVILYGLIHPNDSISMRQGVLYCGYRWDCDAAALQYTCFLLYSYSSQVSFGYAMSCY